MIDTEVFLTHYGVKGMKWGVTKSEYKSMSKADRSGYRKKTGRERRAEVSKAYDRSMEELVRTSSKHQNDIFIKTKLPSDIAPTVMTGREFVGYLSRGGIIDKKATDVFGYANTPGGKAAQKHIDKVGTQIWAETQNTHVRKDKK